jgi:hypothetical protein
MGAAEKLQQKIKKLELDNEILMKRQGKFKINLIKFNANHQEIESLKKELTIKN